MSGNCCSRCSPDTITGMIFFPRVFSRTDLELRPICVDSARGDNRTTTASDFFKASRTSEAIAGAGGNICSIQPANNI